MTGFKICKFLTEHYQTPLHIVLKSANN